MQMELSKKYLVSPERAEIHAATQIHLAMYSNTPGISAWRSGINFDEAQTIYDLNGQPLFYDFTVYSNNDDPVGIVRATASTVLGVPVCSVYLGAPRWDIGKANEKAKKLVEKKFRAQVASSKLVCYAYPKLGIALEWVDPRKHKRGRTIIDVSDLSIIPEIKRPKARGVGAWSIYDKIPTRKVPGAVKKYALHNNFVSRLKRSKKFDIVKSLSGDKFALAQAQFAKYYSSYEAKILSFCTHSFSHECFRMHGQETDVWCVVATGQMILDFWRYYETQSNIATAMGTGAGGTGWTGEVNGLESLTCNHFDAQSDLNPSFSKAMKEINANRPFDYSYPRHAMACVGYSRYKLTFLNIDSVYLYDPWPVNTGAIRWEVWGTETVTVISERGTTLALIPTSVVLANAQQALEKLLQQAIDQKIFVWASAKMSEPLMVRSAALEPAFWIVPFEHDNAVLGYIELDLRGQYTGHTYFYEDPGDLSTCPSLVTRISSKDASRMATDVFRQYENCVFEKPAFVFYKSHNKLVWMIEVKNENQVISRIFVTPTDIYERTTEDGVPPPGVRGEAHP
jgi:hypothetical protein